MDTRLLGKPQEFHGEHERWRDWSAVFRGYAGAVNEGLATLMPWAVARTAVVLNASLSTDQARDRQQLYWMLPMLLKQGPLHILLNAGDGEGLEAWRCLQERYEPRVRMRFAAQLMTILSYSVGGDLVERLGSWERDIHEYQRSSGKNLDDEVRIGAFLLRLPEGPVKTHLLMRVDQLQTWVDFHDEVMAVTRAMAAAQTIPSPMDIGAVADDRWQEESWPEDEWYDWSEEHEQWDEDQWYEAGDTMALDVNALGKGKSKGKKGKGGKSKGKGKAKGPRCYTCGNMGHVAAECYAATWPTTTTTKGGGARQGRWEEGQGARERKLLDVWPGGPQGARVHATQKGRRREGRQRGGQRGEPPPTARTARGQSRRQRQQQAVLQLACAG